MQRAILGALIVALGCMPATSPVPPPPQIDPVAIEIEAFGIRDLLDQVQMGPHALVLEETSLEDVQRMTGAGQVSHAGSGKERRSWICYSRTDELIWFVSAGATEVLRSVSAEQTTAADPRIQLCPRLPAALESISFEFGWLGMSADLMMERLGEPSAVAKGDRMIFHFRGRKRRRERVPGSISALPLAIEVNVYLEAQVVDFRVVSINLLRVTNT